MNSIFLPQLQRFLYSHYLLGGLRQAAGILLPVIVLGGGFQLYSMGIIASMGALCVAVIDQPGGPKRYRTNEMLGGIALGTITVALTTFAAGSLWGTWILVPILCFFFSMLNVYGPRGGLIGFACLLLMTLSLREPTSDDTVLLHTLFSFTGGLFYFAFSLLFRRLLWLGEERRTLSMALHATAKYMLARSKFYDVHSDLDATYRDLIKAQSSMAELQQAARDMVLRELPKELKSRGDQDRTTLLFLYTNMVALLDTLVATHTDYHTLRRKLGESDFMEFAHDALQKQSAEVVRIALNVSRRKKTVQRISVKAEIRAMEYELERYKQKGMQQQDPELYGLLLQVLRRLRVAKQTIDHMAANTKRAGTDIPLDQYLEKSLSRFLSREEIQIGLLRSNLRLSSSSFRYAIRVTVAAMLALAIPALAAYFTDASEPINSLANQSNWIILTILVILKPGFAQTKQRNTWRLGGTALGCLLTFILFSVTENKEFYFIALLVAYVMGKSLVQLHYLLSAAFLTISALISFQFLYASSTFVISERFIDTLIGCAIALLCSYVLPKWEASSMSSFAREAQQANMHYLTTGLQYAELNRHYQQAVQLHAANPDSEPVDAAMGSQLAEAETQWQLAKRQVYISFDNFASGFYRMMDEPANRQRDVALFNNLLIQNHVLASQISASIPLLATIESIPPGIQQAITAIQGILHDQPVENTTPTLETEGELAMLAYPLRQMIKASQLIQQDMKGLDHASTAQPLLTAS